MQVNHFSLDDLRHSQPIQGWDIFWSEGKAFLATAVAAYEKKKNAFTADILYNIIAMSIEKFVMAALMRHGAMPYNHTMGDLVEAMDETFPDAMGDIREGLVDLDKYQEICDIDTYTISPPSMEAIPGMLQLANKLRSLVVNELI